MLINCTSITKKNWRYSYKHKRKQEEKKEQNEKGKFYTMEKSTEELLWVRLLTIT